MIKHAFGLGKSHNQPTESYFNFTKRNITSSAAKQNFIRPLKETANGGTKQN